MKGNLAIVSVILAFAVSSFAAPAPSAKVAHASRLWRLYSLDSRQVPRQQPNKFLG